MPWFDIAVILLLLNGLFAGWREGFFASAFRCVGLVLALYLTDLISDWLPISVPMTMISFVIVFVLALWLSRILLDLVTGHSFGRFGLPDRILGALVNGLFTAVMVWIVAEVILTFDPTITWIIESTSYGYISDLVASIAPDLGTFLSPTSTPEPPPVETTGLD